MLKGNKAVTFQGGLYGIQLKAKWDKRPADVAFKDQIQVRGILNGLFNLRFVIVGVDHGHGDGNGSHGKNDQCNDGNQHITDGFHDSGFLPIFRSLQYSL